MDQPSQLTRRTVALGFSASLVSLKLAAEEAKAADDFRILTASPHTRKLQPTAEKQASLLAYNGETPGPLLRIRKGQPLNLRLVNQLNSPTSLHFYGVRGANAFDGAAGLTQNALKPGESFEYKLKPPDGGLFWYHPLVLGQTAEQVDRGLSGLLIVDEPDAPSVEADLAVIIDDWRLDSSGEIDPSFKAVTDMARNGRLGNLLTVNGLPAPQPIAAAPGGRIRLRFLNVTSARVCPLKFENIHASVIAIDGQPCDPFDPLRRTVIMAPGSRFDIIVDLPSESSPEGRVGIALAELLPLLTVQARGAPVPARPPLTALAGNGLPAEIKLQNAERADLVISGGLPRLAPGVPEPSAADLARLFPDPTKLWRLNGGSLGGFDGKPLLRVKRGLPIVLGIVNRSAWSQVIHVHGHNFRLLHPFDDGWEPYFLDTLYVAEGRTAHISFVADNPGRWAVRSSILEHFESGVLTWFEVL
jgi:FtsP/CotA-like multicopper oxidase with cupredoxin domain